MLSVLQYATSGPWIWLGSAVLLSIASNGAWHAFAAILSAVRR